MKNLILVIGRSGSGKGTLIRYATNAINYPRAKDP